MVYEVNMSRQSMAAALRKEPNAYSTLGGVTLRNKAAAELIDPTAAKAIGREFPICTECGVMVYEHDRYCRNCGARFLNDKDVLNDNL